MCTPHRQYQEHKIRITRALSSWILIQHQAPTRSHSDTYYTQLSQTLSDYPKPQLQHFNPSLLDFATIEVDLQNACHS